MTTRWIFSPGYLAALDSKDQLRAKWHVPNDEFGRNLAELFNAHPELSRRLVPCPNHQGPKREERTHGKSL